MDNREEPEEFIFHHGDDTLEPEPNKLSWLIETCEKYRDEILETTLRKTANQICDICHHSYIAKLETERCGMVFPVRFRVNQEKNANFFKDLLVDEFKNRSMNWLPAVKIIVLEE